MNKFIKILQKIINESNFFYIDGKKVPIEDVNFYNKDDEFKLPQKNKNNNFFDEVITKFGKKIIKQYNNFYQKIKKTGSPENHLAHFIYNSDGTIKNFYHQLVMTNGIPKENVSDSIKILNSLIYLYEKDTKLFYEIFDKEIISIIEKIFNR